MKIEWNNNLAEGNLIEESWIEEDAPDKDDAFEDYLENMIQLSSFSGIIRTSGTVKHK